MKKLINKLRNKGLLKIILSSLFEILLVYITLSSDEIGTFGTVVCLVLWSIVSIVYFIGGIINIKNYKINVDKYIKTPNYKELDNEYNNSKKFSNVCVGEKHVFVLSTSSFHVLNLNDIENMYYLHLGANPVKGRPGYYYLFLKDMNIEDIVKIYFVSKRNLKEVMDYIKNKNDNIIIGKDK